MNLKKQATDASVIIAATGEWPRESHFGPVKGFIKGISFFATDAQKKASYPYENEEDDEEEPAPPAPDDDDDDEDEDDYEEDEEDEEDEEPGETQQEEVPYPSTLIYTLLYRRYLVPTVPLARTA